MEKYYWNPTREDRIGVCFGIFKDDNLVREQVRTPSCMILQWLCVQLDVGRQICILAGS